MPEEEKTSIFRKKTVDSIQSPEVLDDYLKVTSPGVWIFLLAVVFILVGVILWGVFGSIDTSVKFALVAEEESAVCVVPYDSLSDILNAGEVSLAGDSYTLSGELYEPFAVTEDTDVHIRIAGGFDIGDVVIPLALSDYDAANGVFEATVTTESLKPISLLLR